MQEKTSFYLSTLFKSSKITMKKLQINYVNYFDDYANDLDHSDKSPINELNICV